MQGICVQIMGVPPGVYSNVRQAAPWAFPPAMFVHMPRDQRTAAVVAEDIAALKAQVCTLILTCEGLTPRRGSQI